MKDSELHSNRTLLLCILITLPIALFLNLGSYQLLFEEPRRALVAIEMLIRGNSVVPTTNGVLYYNKPPLYNWVLISLFKLFGAEDWVVRLPTVFSVIATSFIHYYFSRRYIGKVPALLSSLFYLTCADILFYFSYLGEIDLFFAFVVYLQAISIFYFYQRRQFFLLFAISYLLTAAGVLTKGIPSIVFQGISLLVIFILNREFRKLFSLSHLLGILLFLLAAGGYFWVYSKYYPVEPYLARLFTETFSRSAMENSTGTNLMHWLKFPLMLVKISTPWCLLFLIPSAYKKHINGNRFLGYCFWFVIANISIYWISPGTRDRYLYMFFPFILSCLAYGIVYSNFKYRDTWLRRFCKYIGVIIVMGLAALSILALNEEMRLAAIACVGLSVTSAVLMLKQFDPFKFILTLILLILIGRVGLDLAVLPTRKKNDPYKADARRMADIIKWEKIYLLGEPEKTSDAVRLAGFNFGTFQRDEPTFLSFQTSFYLSKFTGTVVQYTNDRNASGFYIAREGYIPPGNIEVFYRFKNRKDLWFLLFKFKNK